VTTEERVEIPMREGWIVKAKKATANGVSVGDRGEIRRTGIHEYHLVYWIQRRCTSYYRGEDLERL
jgi:hypothetical protein